MKFVKVKSVYKKEMLDILRDKKALIMMLLVPLLLYPLLAMGILLLTSTISSTIMSAQYDIVILESEDCNYDREAFIEMLEDNDDEYGYHLKVVDTDNPNEQLIKEAIDAYIVVGEELGKLTFEVHYFSSVTNSSTASDMIEDKINTYEILMKEKLLDDMGLDSELILNPIEIDWVDKSNKEEKMGSMVGAILPFILITSILMGAGYTAIDATAGERERGTLETLLTLPVRNDELIIGKFLAVSTLSVVSAILNMISISIMAGFMFSFMDISGEQGQSVELVSFVPAVIIVMLCVISFSLFASAIMMCITTFAKTFKEANNYLTPLLLVMMLMGYVSFIPNIEFDLLMASIPVVNICLLINNILVFKYEFSLIFVVLTTNIAYAALSIWALSKIYNSEDVLFGEGGVSLQIFTNRKQLKKGGVPNFSDAVIVISVTMLLMFYVGSIVQVKMLLAGLLVTQAIIIGVPLFAAWYTKKDFKKTFLLNLPGITDIIGASLLEIGTFFIMAVLSGILTKIWPQDTESLSQSFQIILDGVTFLPALLVIALAPAICEEALFRGYLFSSVKNKFKPVTAILIVAALFGIYHMSLVKFFTTGLLGAAFCYVVYKTGSIVLSVLMHFINNAFSVIMMYHSDKLETILPILFKETLTPIEMLTMAGVAIISATLGIILLSVKNKTES